MVSSKSAIKLLLINYLKYMHIMQLHPVPLVEAHSVQDRIYIVLKWFSLLLIPLSTVPEVIPTHEDMEVIVKVTRELKGYIASLEGLR